MATADLRYHPHGEVGMGLCTVTVELDDLRQGSGPVTCGEPLRGVVVVDVDSEVEASALEVELLWATRGRGKPVTQPTARAVLPGVRLVPGAPARLPFEIQVPEGGPVSYRGELFELGWQVRARVDLPWALDACGEKSFDVVAGPRTTPFRSQPLAVGKNLAKGVGGCITVVALQFVVGGLGILGAALYFGSLVLFMFGLSFTSIAGLVVVLAVSRHRAQKAMGNAAVGLLPARVAPGGEVEVRLDLPQALLGRIRSVSCRLVGEEVVVVRRDKHLSSENHVHFEAEVPMTPSSIGTFQRYCGRVRIPDNAAATVDLLYSRVLWHAIVKATIVGVPGTSWDEELEVDVVRPVDQSSPVSP